MICSATSASCQLFFTGGGAPPRAPRAAAARGSPPPPRTDADTSPRLSMASARCGRRRLPHATLILPHHRRVGSAREGFLELRHVGHGAVHAVLPGRMRIGRRAHALELGPTILAPDLAEPDE